MQQEENQTCLTCLGRAFAKKRTNPEGFLSKILDQLVSQVTGQDIITNLEVLQKLIFSSRRRIVGIGLAADTNIYFLELAKPISKEYISSIPRARVQINSLFTTYRLLDTKAEINIITDKLARAAGLAI